MEKFPENDDITEDINSEIKLPVNTIEDLETLESKLGNSTELKSKIVSCKIVVFA